ncbi:uncharacterized protein LOC143908158 isoform X2 [Temnothorax americanus]|uniref:uncharacterized protein LOC143908158 isoform X2 n=1 Tax=Temnothorax americanus TaxID=1964332 RepID=UPI004068E427
MYNGHEYLSCIKIPAAKQAVTKSTRKPEKAEPMDFTADRRDLISVANKVFGEGKWNHTVVSQNLDFIDTIDARDECCAGCVSFVKVQLDDGNFHEDVGYYVAEESTKGLSIQNARIGSAVNALKRVLLSFGDNIERELRQLRRQISPEQTNDVQKDVARSLDKQISRKSNVSVDESGTAPQTECLISEPDLKGVFTPSFKELLSNKFSLTERTGKPEAMKSYPLPNKTNTTTEQKPKSDPTLVSISTVNNGTTEANPSSSVIIPNVKKEREPSPNKTSSTIEQKSKPALSKNEMLRLERKRKQLEKQMEFKKRMMEKGELMSTSDSKPNPRRKQNQQELEQQQNFMNSVCADYHALLRIFQYLKVQELLRAARVCKMWRDLAAHPSLWKTVRMKNSQVTDWDGLADTLQRRGTQHLDLRKMLVAGESDNIWRKFLTVIPRVTSLVKLELCRCPVMVVEEVIKSCPQLEVFSAMSIKCDSLTLESIGNLSQCQELRLKAITGMSLQQDLTPLQDLKHLTQLSLTSVKELGKKKIDVIQSLTNLETLELGECSDFPDKFGTTVLINLNKLERLRLEKGQGSCCTFDILEGVARLENLSQMELVNFDVKNGFDKCLANCKNIKRLLIIPTYISQSATSNNMVLGGVTELSDNLTHFIWGVTLELLRVTELFVNQCNLMSKQVTGDSIPVLKPVPCLRLIADVEVESENQIGNDNQQPHQTSPQVDILPLPQLQKLLLTALPKTRVKILKIPFHATWRQSISDTTTQ